MRCCFTACADRGTGEDIKPVAKGKLAGKIPTKSGLPGFRELFSTGLSFIVFLIISADGN